MGTLSNKLYFILILLMVLLQFSCDKRETKDQNRNDNAILLDIQLEGSLQNPAFSPDDNSIVFTRFVNGYNAEPAEIYKYHLTSKKLDRLINNKSGNVNLPGSVWINDKIIFSSSREPHDEIYIIDENGAIGSEIKVTSRIDKVAYEPTMSPNGEWIVFESHKIDVVGDGEILKYRIDHSSPYIELTNAIEDCRQPNWSPKGDKILYQRNINEKWSIWLMDIDGNNKYQLTTNIGNCTDASFTESGTHVVYSSDYNVAFANIYRIATNGLDVIKLTDFDGYDGAPSMSYDGSKLIFESVVGDPDESKGTKLYLLDL